MILTVMVIVYSVSLLLLAKSLRDDIKRKRTKIDINRDNLTNGRYNVRQEEMEL